MQLRGIDAERCRLIRKRHLPSAAFRHPVADPGKELRWCVSLLREDDHLGAAEDFTPVIAIRTHIEARRAMPSGSGRLWLQAMKGPPPGSIHPSEARS